MQWQKVLAATRRVARYGGITSEALAANLGINTNTASAWLGKFCRWGYVLRAGSTKGATRWVRVYTLTRWGKRYKI